MADFAAMFIEPNGVIQLLPTADPINYAAVIMPYTNIPDPLPPTVALVSPALGKMSPTATVVVRIYDAFGIVRVNLWVEYENGNSETIYGRGQFMRAFAGSTMTVLETGKHYEFALRRLGGWPRGGLDFQFEPVDVGGNVSV